MKKLSAYTMSITYGPDREGDYQKHLSTLTADGSVLNPSDYRPLNRWTFVLHQLTFADSMLDALAQTERKLGSMADSYEEYGRLTAVVVTYARCFVSAGPGVAQLDANKVFEEEPALRKIHDRMMELRHRAFAHSEEGDMMRVSLTVKEEATRITVRPYMTIITSSKDVADFKKAVDFAGRYVTTQLNKFLDGIETRVGKPI